jgi:DNA-directed RNA polymerase subunit omega
MARITVEDCIDKFESRFELVLVASNRARKLHSGESPTVEKDNDKPTVIALREIADETVEVDSLKEKLIQEYQTVSPLDEEELSLDYNSSDTENKEEMTEDDARLSESNEELQVSNEDGSSGDEDISILARENDESTVISDDDNPENL